jgi:hypothetical protein
MPRKIPRDGYLTIKRELYEFPTKGGGFMAVLRLLTVFISTVLLTGCATVEKNVDDIRDYFHSIPTTIHCQPAGTSQNIICNHRFIVKHIGGNLYQGYIDPDLVKEGVVQCKKNVENKVAGFESYLFSKNFKCQEAIDFTYDRYEFEVEGPRPREDVPEEFINVAHSNKLRLGHVKEIYTPKP